jgi:hypothetical protein
LVATGDAGEGEAVEKIQRLGAGEAGASVETMAVPEKFVARRNPKAASSPATLRRSRSASVDARRWVEPKLMEDADAVRKRKDN